MSRWAWWRRARVPQAQSLPEIERALRDRLSAEDQRDDVRVVIEQAMWDRLKVGENVPDAAERVIAKLAAAGYVIARRVP